MNGYSSFEEIINRKCPLTGGKAEIIEIEKSVIRADTYILIFKSGDQANCNGEVYNKLNK